VLQLLEANMRATGPDWLESSAAAAQATCVREYMLALGRALRALDARLPRWIWGIRDPAPLATVAAAADRVLVAGLPLLFSPAQLADAVEDALRAQPLPQSELVCQLAASPHISALLEDAGALRRVLAAALQVALDDALRQLDPADTGLHAARPGRGTMCPPLQLLVRLQGQLLAVCAAAADASVAASEGKRSDPSARDDAVDVLHAYAHSVLEASSRVLERARLRLMTYVCSAAARFWCC
jgi:hypothetical protein